MFLRGEIEAARCAPAGEFDIAALVLAKRNVIGGTIGEGSKRIGLRRIKLTLLLLERGQLRLERSDFGHQRCRVVLALLGLGRTDRLRGLVAAVLGLLQPGRQRAPRGIQG